METGPHSQRALEQQQIGRLPLGPKGDSTEAFNIACNPAALRIPLIGYHGKGIALRHLDGRWR